MRVATPLAVRSALTTAAVLLLAGCGAVPASHWSANSVDGDLPPASGALQNNGSASASSTTSPTAKTHPRFVAAESMDQGTSEPSEPAPVHSTPKPKPEPIALSSLSAPTDLDGAKASQEQAFENLDIVDTGLQGQISVLRVGSNRTHSDLLAAFATLKNRTSHVLEIEAQTIYQDNAGNAIGAGTASWVPLTLPPHQKTEYRSTALSADAADFTINLRRAKPSQP